jgi:hypothetical protein
VPTPAQPLPEEDLVNPAAPHGNALVLQQICGQAVERPRGERQTEVAWTGQRGRNDTGDLVGGVGRGTTAAVVILQRRQALLVEPVDPATHRVRIEPKRCGDARRRLAPAGAPDHAGALNPPGRFGARAGQYLHCRALFRCQIPEANTHGAPPSQERRLPYPMTSRMNH